MAPSSGLETGGLATSHRSTRHLPARASVSLHLGYLTLSTPPRSSTPHTDKISAPPSPGSFLPFLASSATVQHHPTLALPSRPDSVMDRRVLWLIHDDDRALAASYNFNPPPPPPHRFPAIPAHHPTFWLLPTQGTSTVLMCGAPSHPVIQPYALLISEIFRLVSPQLHQLTTTVSCATATAAIQITSTPEPPAGTTVPLPSVDDTVDAISGTSCASCRCPPRPRCPCTTSCGTTPHGDHIAHARIAEIGRTDEHVRHGRAKSRLVSDASPSYHDHVPPRLPAFEHTVNYVEPQVCTQSDFRGHIEGPATSRATQFMRTAHRSQGNDVLP